MRVLRIPFVRRCQAAADSVSTVVFIVNISVQGAYMTDDMPGTEPLPEDWPQVAQDVLFRFALPGNDQLIEVHGQVTWLNHKQQHPVHSLPPGFGVKFRDLQPQDSFRIARMIDEYIQDHPGAGR